MNIFKVERTDKVGYDEYDSFVIIAESENEARVTDPSGKPVEDSIFSSWVKVRDLDKLIVTLIGVANEDQEPGIVLTSFNAG